MTASSPPTWAGPPRGSWPPRSLDIPGLIPEISPGVAARLWGAFVRIGRRRPLLANTAPGHRAGLKGRVPVQISEGGFAPDRGVVGRGQAARPRKQNGLWDFSPHPGRLCAWLRHQQWPPFRQKRSFLWAAASAPDLVQGWVSFPTL